MNKNIQHYDPNFEPDQLNNFQGYGLQLFASGRIKITLQTMRGVVRPEYYADAPKRDREAFLRQKKRSGTALKHHFAVVDKLLAELDDYRVFRVHTKGNNNETADNAHIVTSMAASSVFCTFGQLVHEWQISRDLISRLYQRDGARKGVASLFNEYAASYDHDWEDAVFDKTGIGPRVTGVSTATWSAEYADF